MSRCCALARYLEQFWAQVPNLGQRGVPGSRETSEGYRTVDREYGQGAATTAAQAGAERSLLCNTLRDPGARLKRNPRVALSLGRVDRG
ncbi:hypothetical protein HYE67_007180 [Fusarium culmorum]|uniref:Uncharacterized protein n=1 Tax=Fusarium culmorum TaxID=5516 RepID=A0A7S8DAC9_FUSCU|nr:hypothetical protein HYE67_007180 [Fusarium culmorum]